MIWLFDIDGTLIQSGGAGSLAMGEALSHAFGAPKDTSGVSFSGRTDYAITRDLFEVHGIPVSSETMQVFWGAYLERLPKALSQCEGAVLPGALDWIRHIAADVKCSVGIVTGNMKAAAEIKLRHFGLAQYFDFGGYGDSSPDRNDVAAAAVADARRYLQETAKPNASSNVPNSKIWVIGDTPFDISCARSQSLRVIGVATGGFSIEELSGHSPDITLPSLADKSVLVDLLNTSFKS